VTAGDTPQIAEQLQDPVAVDQQRLLDELDPQEARS
jgi:hypothetical protein